MPQRKERQAASAHVRELTTEECRDATLLADGGRIEARRIFPHPHKHWLVKKDGTRYATPLALAVVAALVRERLVTVTRETRPERDEIDYAATERCLDVVLAGGELRDEPDTQTDLVAEGSAAHG